LNQRFNADNKDEPEFLEVALNFIRQFCKKAMIISENKPPCLTANLAGVLNANPSPAVVF
jgi:hypothetical protein